LGTFVPCTRFGSRDRGKNLAMIVFVVGFGRGAGEWSRLAWTGRMEPIGLGRRMEPVVGLDGKDGAGWLRWRV
jgi:hypothetical protein